MVVVEEGSGTVDAGEVCSSALALMSAELLLDDGVIANLS
jgi:hypothetical protein